MHVHTKKPTLPGKTAPSVEDDEVRVQNFLASVVSLVLPG